MTVVRRPDQRQVGTARAGVGPAPSNVVFARVVIVSGEGEGVFSYSPAAGVGDLVAAITQSLTDSYGNATIEGIAAYSNGAGTATQLGSSGIAWYDGSESAGWANIASLINSADGSIVLGSSQSGSNIGQAWIWPSGDITGVTDSASIATALNNWKTVFLIPGMYYINQTIVIPSGAILDGQSRSLGIPIGDYGNGGLPLTGAILNLVDTWDSATYPNAMELQSGESEGAPTTQLGSQVLRGLTITGTDLPASSVNGIHAFNAAAVTMSDVTVYGMTGDGLHAAAGAAGGPPDFWDVDHCKFSGNNGYGIYIDGMADSWFSIVECTGNQKYGWYITNCNNTRLVSCKSEGNTYGFYTTSLGGFTGQVSFMSCTTQQNSLSGFFFTGAGSPDYILGDCRSADDGSGSASSGYAGLQLSGITGTATFEVSNWFTGLGTGPACPEYGVSITTCPDTTVNFSSTLANGVTTGMHSDASAVIICDPSVTFTPVSTADYQALSNNWLYVGAAGEPGFGGGWANTGGSNAELAFMTERPGVVRIKGYVTNSVAGNTANIFVLPAGYIPKSQQIFACVENGAVYGNSVVVQTSGDVVMFNAAGGGNYSIDCLVSLSI